MISRVALAVLVALAGCPEPSPAQSWPKPATRLDAGLTVRYVRSLSLATP